MKRINLKLSYNEALCLSDYLGNHAVSNGRNKITRALVLVVLHKYNLKLQQRLLFKWQKPRQINLEAEVAIALMLLVGDKPINHFTEYELAVIAPIIELIHKTFDFL